MLTESATSCHNPNTLREVRRRRGQDVRRRALQVVQGSDVVAEGGKTKYSIVGLKTTEERTGDLRRKGIGYHSLPPLYMQAAPSLRLLAGSGNKAAWKRTDTDDLAVDPLTVLGGEEANNTGNIDGLADTVHWAPCGSILINLVIVHLITSRDVLLAHGVVHVGLDTAGSNAVDSDLLVTAV
jgi:hypothetical protein